MHMNQTTSIQPPLTVVLAEAHPTHQDQCKSLLAAGKTVGYVRRSCQFWPHTSPNLLVDCINKALCAQASVFVWVEYVCRCKDDIKVQLKEI